MNTIFSHPITPLKFSVVKRNYERLVRFLTSPIIRYLHKIFLLEIFLLSISIHRKSQGVRVLFVLHAVQVPAFTACPGKFDLNSYIYSSSKQSFSFPVVKTKVNMMQ